MTREEIYKAGESGDTLKLIAEVAVLRGALAEVLGRLLGIKESAAYGSDWLATSVASAVQPSMDTILRAVPEFQEMVRDNP